MKMKSATATGGLERIIRTVFQLALGAAGSFPALIAIFHVSPGLTAKIIGIVSVIVLAVTTAQNALEGKGIIPAMLRFVPPAVATDAKAVIAAVPVAGLTAVADEIRASAHPSTPPSVG